MTQPLQSVIQSRDKHDRSHTSSEEVDEEDDDNSANWESCSETDDDIGLSVTSQGEQVWRNEIPELLTIPSSVATQAHSGDLCDTCETLNITAGRFKVGLRDRDKQGGIIDIGTLEDVLNKPHCPLCCTIIEAAGGRNLPTSDVGVQGKPVQVRLGILWEWGGFLQVTKRPQIRHIGIYFLPEDEFPHILNTQSLLFNNLTQISLLANDAPGPNSERVFFGRIINESQIDFAMVRTWIRMCEEWHGSDCEKSILPRSEPAEIPFFRLIDVQEQCLTLAPSGCKYVALSYVWGRVNSLNTVKENLDALERPGGLIPYMNNIPTTIQDAMELVRQLDMRYLWVDSLCIVQDDAANKGGAIAAMDLVYRGAFLTIIAARGENANAGLPGVRQNSRGTSQYIKQIKPGLRLVVLPHEIDSKKRSVYYRRGWTYQEDYFSRRKLIFADGRVAFMCGQAEWREDVVCEDERIRKFEPSTFRTEGEDWDAPGALLGDLGAYSELSLTFQSDIFNAFAGLATVFGPRMDANWCYGLPDSLFDWALLWEAENSAERRPGIPSWSWAGWMGGMTMGTKLSSMHLTTLRKWLSDHTWIIWYIRMPDSTDTTLLWAPTSSSSRVTTDATNFYGGPSVNHERFPFDCTQTQPTSYAIKHAPQYTGDTLSRNPTSGLLQFWTVSVILYVSDVPAGDSSPRVGLRNVGLFDRGGQIVGYTWVKESWYEIYGSANHEFLFLCEGLDQEALSEVDSNEIAPGMQSDADDDDDDDDDLGWLESSDEDEGSSQEEGAEHQGSSESERSVQDEEQDSDIRDWDLYMVMLIQWHGDWAERVALGEIERSSFQWEQVQDPGPVWKEIVLA